MSKIIEVKFNGMIRSDFLKFFKNNFENSLIKEDMDDVQVISVDDLYFKFEKDKLKEVSTDSL